MKTFKNIIKSTKYSIKLLNSKLLNNKFKFNKYSSFVSIKLQIHDSNNKFDSTWGSKPEWFGSANPIKIKQNSHSNNKHMVYQIKKYYGQINNRYNCHYNNNYMCNQIREYSSNANNNTNNNINNNNNNDTNNNTNNDTNNNKNDDCMIIDLYLKIGTIAFIGFAFLSNGGILYKFYTHMEDYDVDDIIIGGPFMIGICTLVSACCAALWPVTIPWAINKVVKSRSVKEFF